ncbi:MAG: hypothetical protein QXZ43_04810 [Candidatus Aenigmatarchaeota archaeon]
MFKRKIFVAMSFFVTVLFLLPLGCRESKYGQAIPANIKVVKLKEIIKNPENYKDKEVVLEGNFGGICCAADFNYKEGSEVVEVYPKGFSIPKLNRGKPIRIYGVVRTIKKMVEANEDTKEGTNNQEKSQEVYIEAKGMQVK